MCAPDATPGSHASTGAAAHIDQSTKILFQTFLKYDLVYGNAIVVVIKVEASPTAPRKRLGQRDLAVVRPVEIIKGLRHHIGLDRCETERRPALNVHESSVPDTSEVIAAFQR